METYRKTTAKVLYYTISTPDATALACSRLLHKSLNNKLGPVDFKIVVPQGSESQYPKDMLHLLLPSVKPSPTYPLILDFKYTPTVYDLDYDNFVYLDSDILWFINDFDPTKNQYCEEKCDIREFYFTTGWYSQPKPGLGVNAGFFCVDKTTGINMIDQISKSLIQRDVKLITYLPLLEQSMFNLYLHNIDYNGWHKITDKFNNFTRPESIFEDNKNYHFQGWNGNMDSKIHMMNCFINNNSSAEAIKALKL